MNNKDKIILDLCGGTGSWSEPYRQAGYTVYNITLPFYDVTNFTVTGSDKGEFIVFYGSLDLFIDISKIHGILAAPPCTDFSLACNRLWSDKDNDGRTAKSLKIVQSCLDIISFCHPRWWALENPRGRLHKFIGLPFYKFYHFEFGSPFYKPTWLWGWFNTLFVKGPILDNLKPLDEALSSELYQLPKGYNLNIDHSKRAAKRSILPPNFCEQFFLANP